MHILNTFGSLAVASMLVVGGAGVAGANNITISGDSAIFTLGSAGQLDTDKVTTSNADVSLNDYFLHIDGRTAVLDTMTIDSRDLTGDLSVTLLQGSGSVTGISSASLNVVGYENTVALPNPLTTTYTISAGLTHTVTVTCRFKVQTTERLA